MEIRDYTNAVVRYERALERLASDKRLPAKNRELAVDWIKKKKEELEEDLALKEKEQDSHRRCKTLIKYCYLLTNVCFWFPDLTKITKKDLAQFKKDFFNDEIRSIGGKILKCKRDYITKVFRSGFFKNHLQLRSVVDEVFSGKMKKSKNTVEFIELDDLKKMVEIASYSYQKLILYLLFSTGMRIGTLLNMRKRDFELKYNPKTKVHYYLCHIKAEYTKSKEPRAIPIIIPECNDSLKKHMEKLKDEDFIVEIGYSAVNNLLEKVTVEAGIVTKPNKQKPHIHILRKSTAIFLLNAGYTTDQVKAWLGHKPSSTAIDVYVNYIGLSFEPEVTKVQTDELLKLQDTIKENDMKMAMLQSEYNKMRDTVSELSNKLDEREDLIKESLVEDILKKLKHKVPAGQAH
ncbi:site-specific integrase [Candidatus Pacearchaeota archaeon]|nr:site-specific integrase [Candidatus Pacearchaeota archaeon]